MVLVFLRIWSLSFLFFILWQVNSKKKQGSHKGQKKEAPNLSRW
jgi:hypothetical protein